MPNILTAGKNRSNRLTMPPDLYVIAGPNGIGKTTSSFDIVPASIPIINSDEIAAAVRNAGIIKTNTQEYSNREATRLMNEYLEKRASFCVETNLADTETWKFLIETQKLGYTIILIYLSTDDVQILNERIERRALAGEHYVRPDIVQQRYVDSLKLLNHYFRIPDYIKLLDNSGSLKLIAEIRQGEIYIYTALPSWVQEYLSSHFEQQQQTDQKKAIHMDSIEDVRKSYQASKQKADDPGKSREKNLDYN